MPQSHSKNVLNPPRLKKREDLITRSESDSNLSVGSSSNNNNNKSVASEGKGNHHHALHMPHLHLKAPHLKMKPPTLKLARVASSPLALSRGAALVGLLASATAQLPPASGTAGTCDFDTIQSRINAFNTECCTTVECFASGGCSVSCATVLPPLVADCGPVLDAVYDATDSSVDGSASIFRAGATACAAPAEPVDPVAGNAGTCNLGTLDERITRFNSACCTSKACFVGGVCSVDCAVVLLPLVADCGSVLDALYDAGMFATGSEACLSISSTDALQRVQELHDAGSCPDAVLDAVGEVDVTSTCEDTNPNCDSFLGMGLLCDGLVGQCDATCLICTPDPSQQTCVDTNPNCEQFLASGLACGTLRGGRCARCLQTTAMSWCR